MGPAPPDGPAEQPRQRRPSPATAGLATTLVGLTAAALLWGAPTLSEPTPADPEERAAKEIGRSAQRAPTRSAEGHDVSWPNCPKGAGRLRTPPGLPLPPLPGQFVVIGLTEGPGFYPNPCLADQVAWAKRRKLATAAYAVASYPTSAQLARHGGAGPKRARLRAAGHAQASVNIESMRRTGLASPIVWIDIEPVRLRPWSADRQANRSVIEGAARAYREAGFQVGFYSYSNGWAEIVGAWQLPDSPVWATAATAGRQRALQKCREPSFGGGPVVLVQWHDDRHDYDATCPGVTMADYFAPP